MTERCSRASSHHLGKVQGSRSQRVLKGVLAFWSGFCPRPLIQIIASRLCQVGRVCCCIANQPSSLVVAAGLPSRRVRIRRRICSRMLTTGISTFGARREASASERFQEKGCRRQHRGSTRAARGAETKNPPEGRVDGMMPTTWGGWRLPGRNLQTVQTLICALTLELLCARVSHMAYFAGRTHLKSIS